MSTKFIKVVEDFTCENCGKKVKGNGFTNHCPYCLWSKHVDVFPGDRNADCHGMMEPVELEIISGEYILTHKCVVCGYTKKNKTSPDDDFDKILRLSQSISNRYFKKK